MYSNPGLGSLQQLLLYNTLNMVSKQEIWLLRQEQVHRLIELRKQYDEILLELKGAAQKINVVRLLNSIRELFNELHVNTSSVFEVRSPLSPYYHYRPNSSMNDRAIIIFSDDVPITLTYFIVCGVRAYDPITSEIINLPRRMGIEFSCPKPITDPGKIRIQSGNFDTKNPWFDAIFDPKSVPLLRESVKSSLSILS
jgi:hypothetical protein